MGPLQQPGLFACALAVPDQRRSRNAEDAEIAERRQEKDWGWGFSLYSSASLALSVFQTLYVTN